MWSGVYYCSRSEAEGLDITFISSSDHLTSGRYFNFIPNEINELLTEEWVKHVTYNHDMDCQQPSKHTFSERHPPNECAETGPSVTLTV